MQIIGKTFDDLFVFKIDETTGVTESGEILKIENNSFRDTVYTSKLYPKETNAEEIKKHIFFNEALLVGDFVINPIDNKINGNDYIYIDYEDMDDEEINSLHKTLTSDDISFIMKYDVVEFVKYRKSSFIIDKNETSFYNIVDEEDKIYLNAIENAFDFELTKFEDFDSLNLDL